MHFRSLTSAEMRRRVVYLLVGYSGIVGVRIGFRFFLDSPPFSDKSPKKKNYVIKRGRGFCFSKIYIHVTVIYVCMSDFVRNFYYVC